MKSLVEKKSSSNIKKIIYLQEVYNDGNNLCATNIGVN
jgi:hypothetical protein